MRVDMRACAEDHLHEPRRRVSHKGPPVGRGLAILRVRRVFDTLRSQVASRPPSQDCPARASACPGGRGLAPKARVSLCLELYGGRALVLTSVFFCLKLFFEVKGRACGEP